MVGMICGVTWRVAAACCEAVVCEAALATMLLRGLTGGNLRRSNNLAHLFSLKSKRRALCSVPLFVLLALTFSISGTVSITVKNGAARGESPFMQ